MTIRNVTLTSDNNRNVHRRKFLKAAVAVGGASAVPGCLEDSIGALESGEWRFDDVTDETGLEYQAQASGVGNGNSGVYVTDFNNDGWPDVLTIGGAEPALFENTGGEFERTDALPDLDIEVQGALCFDATGDGWEDLLVLPRNGEMVFLENDDGEFTRRENGLNVEVGIAVGATAADYDGDGNLEVFVVQYGDWAAGTPEGFLHPGGGYVANDNGAPNLLFNNTGEGFERVEDAGIEGEHWSLAGSFVDLTGDDRPDIHVANDFNNDVLYRNEGDGSFERIVMGSETGRNGMSSEVGDFDGDGEPDVFVSNIYFPLDASDLSDEKRARLERYFEFVLRSKRIEGNNLLINRGDGEFVDKAGEFGVQEGGWGWAAVLADLNNDMRPDLFHATQKVVRIDSDDPYYTFPMLWEGTDDGFEKREAREFGFEETDGRGVAALDYDRDGDVDIIVSTYNDQFVIYENTIETVDDRNSLQVRAVEGNGKTTAIGATVEITVDGTSQVAVQNAKADYQSQDSRTLHFGLADNEHVDRIDVSWPDGTSQLFTNVEANQRVLLTPDGDIQSTPES